MADQNLTAPYASSEDVTDWRSLTCAEMAIKIDALAERIQRDCEESIAASRRCIEIE